MKQREPARAYERLAMAALLLAAIYGSFGVGLVANEMLNDRRDILLNIGHPPEQRVPRRYGDLLFWDYTLMWAGLLVFIVVFGLFMYQIPKFVAGEPEIERHVKVLRALCIALPLVGFFGFLVGGLYDICKMWSYLHAK